MKLFDMLTRADIKRIKEDRGPADLSLQIEQLEMENKKLRSKVRDAEGETSLVKAVGMNSPEMKELKKEKEHLQNKCREAGRAMIELNLKYEATIKKLNTLVEENKSLKVLLKEKL